MDKESDKFWRFTFENSRYAWLGIVLGVIALFWEPAFPYLYLPAFGGFLHFVFDVVFYRKAPRWSFVVWMIMLGFFTPFARDLYPHRSLLVLVVLSLMFAFSYVGMRALLFLLFKPAIIKRIGLKN